MWYIKKSDIVIQRINKKLSEHEEYSDIYLSEIRVETRHSSKVEILVDAYFYEADHINLKEITEKTIKLILEDFCG